MNTNEKTCQHCNHSFTRKPNQTPGTFNRQKYCSPQCRTAATPRGPAKQPRTGHCAYCHEPVATTRKFCAGKDCQYWHIASRLDAQLDKSAGPDACWLWRGPKTQAGYGILGKTSRPGVVVLAHRVAVERVMAMRLPKGMVAAHRCDHPSCANPSHIFATTMRGNMADAKAKGRLVTGPRQRKMTVEIANEIREKYGRGGMTLAMLGDEYGVHFKTIHRVISGLTYRTDEVSLSDLLWPDGEEWVRLVA